MLKHHLNIVCDDVWERLGNSKQYGIAQGEETLTDNLLLYLASLESPEFSPGSDAENI